MRMNGPILQWRTNSLGIAGNIVLRGNRMVLTITLRNRTVELAHEHDGHEEMNTVQSIVAKLWVYSGIGATASRADEAHGIAVATMATSCDVLSWTVGVWILHSSRR